MGDGPLTSVRVVEIGGIGPAPFAAMMLADMGAEVVRIERPHGASTELFPPGTFDGLHRNRTSLKLDIASDGGRAIVLELCEAADALLEGFRPGVMERLGLAPDVVLARNPRLVYGRMTGYGQDGPLASVAGHDINYLALSGVLSGLARRGERPMPPINLLGDFGGGGTLMAFAIVAGILEARISGSGQVIDASMTDGVTLLSTMTHGMRATGVWNDEPGTNVNDTGAHFYEVYETKDGRYMAVGVAEPQFYGELLRVLDIPAEEMPQWDQQRWPEFKERLAHVFATKTRDDWTELFETADACTSPVLTWSEAIEHPHNRARDAFVEVDGQPQPAVTPRFSRTPGAITPRPSPFEVLAAWGVDVPKEVRHA